MMGTAKEFVDFWMQMSVHPRSELGMSGSSQSSSDLAERLIGAAKEQGFSHEAITREIGDPAEYIKAHLDSLNAAKAERRQT